MTKLRDIEGFQVDSFWKPCAPPRFCYIVRGSFIPTSWQAKVSPIWCGLLRPCNLLAFGNHLWIMWIPSSVFCFSSTGRPNLSVSFPQRCEGDGWGKSHIPAQVPDRGDRQAQAAKGYSEYQSVVQQLHLPRAVYYCVGICEAKHRDKARDADFC